MMNNRTANVLSRKVVSFLLLICMLAFSGMPVWAAEEISKLVLSKNAVTLSVDDTTSITATAVFVSGSTSDVTIKTDWSSGDESIVSVYSGSLVAKAKGTTIVTATYMGKTVPIQVTVEKKVSSLTKSKQKLDLRVGKQEQLQLTATYSDGSTEIVNDKAEWTTASDAIATVDRGMVTAIDAGQTTISAKYLSKTVTFDVDVDVAKRLETDPKELSLRIGETGSVKLNATFSDGTVEDVAEKAEWKTDNDQVADAIKGKITAYGSGQATLTGTYGTKQTTVVVTVETANRLTASEKDIFLKVDGSKKVTLTALYADGTTEDVTSKAEWSSTDDSIASTEDGTITGYKVGEATITALYGTKTTTIKVDVGVPRLLELDKTNLTLQKGASGKLALTAVYADGSREDVTDKAEWEAKDTAVAYVHNGEIKALSAGETIVSASYGEISVSAQVAVDVSQSLKLSETALETKEGASNQITATMTYADGTTKDVTALAEWSTGDANIASVYGGKVYSIANGQTTITASYQGKTAVVTVRVEMPRKLELSTADLYLKKGATQKVTLKATYSDGTTLDVSDKATWSSDHEDIAYTVKGTVTAVAVGQATITGTYGGKSVTLAVDVDTAKKLELSTNEVYLKKSGKQKVTVKATYSDGSTEDVTDKATWTSDHEDIAYVVKGTITAAAVGEANITATYGGKSVKLTVDVDVAKRLEISSKTVSLRKGGTSNLTVTAYFADESHEDVTSTAIWTVANKSIADVTKGKITAVAAGETTVTAEFSGQTVTADIEVDLADKLQSSASLLELQVGQTQTVSITAVYADSKTEDVTQTATWQSQNAAVATVSKGRIQAVSQGEAVLTAQHGNKTVQVRVRVGVVQSLAISKDKLVFTKGGGETLVLKATFTDGTVKDVTNEAVWTSSAVGVATVSSNGYVAAVASGKTTITADYGNMKMSASVEVDNAQYLSINPKLLVMEKDDEQTLELTAYYTDGTTEDVTSKAVWTISNNKVAEVINGTVSTFGTGKATVTGTFGTQKVTVPLEVSVAQKITVNEKLVQMKTGDKFQLSVNAVYSDGTTRNVTDEAEWSSRNFKIADVQGGLVEAAATGKTTIGVKYGGKSLSVNIEVNQLKYLKTDVKRLNMKAGEEKTIALIATFKDSTELEVNSSAEWKSSNDKVADVKDGVITAYGKGTATISSKFGGKTTSITVVVK